MSKTALSRPAERDLSRRLLMASVSMTALLAAQPFARAGSGTLGVWGGSAATSAVAVAQAAAQSASQGAAAANKQSQQSLARAAAALQAMQAAQNAARQTYVLNLSGPTKTSVPTSGLQLPPVPDGLTTGGLVADTSSAWTNAQLPTAQTSNGQTTVTVQQTAPSAIANWTTFNIGANTTLDFVQQSSAWSILNRVTGSAASPSQILGHINALGTVLVINQNGIIFGSGSQINVHSLVASTLDVGDAATMATTQARNNFFINNGIAANLGTGISDFSSTTGGTADGTVTVMPGASITTTLLAQDSPGFVYLFGSNVYNYGTITSPAGEVAMVAAQAVTLRPGYYNALQNGAVPAGQPDLGMSFRGTGFTLVPEGPPVGFTKQNPTVYQVGSGEVVNAGLISTLRGITILNGDRIVMSGVISADTSITRNSQVFLDAVTSVDVTGTISIQPYENGETQPLSSGTSNSGSSVAAFTPPSIEMSAYGVTLEPTALISAPGATVALSGVGNNATTGSANFGFRPSIDTSSVAEQVLLRSGATIDVSGLQNVQLPASYNVIAFSPQNGEFADEPLQRNGFLVGKTLYIDIRDSGTRSDGSTWVGTPVGDASGAVSLVGQSIDQLLTVGGSVSLKTDLVPGNKGLVTTQQGSIINVAGGSVQFQPGYVPQTLLIGSDGNIYTMAQADPNMTYVGIVGDFTVAHAHWDNSTTNVTQAFVSPFGGTEVYEPGYIQGSNAGGVAIQSYAAPVLKGAMQFGALTGARQIVSGTVPSQGSFTLTTPQSIIFSDDPGSASETSPNFTSESASTLVLSAAQFSNYGLSNLSVTVNDLYIPANNTVSLAPGGQFNAKTVGAIDLEGSIVARGGQINLSTEANSLNNSETVFSTSLATTSKSASSTTTTPTDSVYIGGTLDVSGLWTNDFGLASNALSGPGFINGGSISIKTLDSDRAPTGSIILTASSVLDVSSGGYINQKGVIKTASFGVPAGNGGNITLATFLGTPFDANHQVGPTPPTESQNTIVQLGGKLLGYGFATGGTLTINTPAFQIGGTPSSDPRVLNLSPSFFTSGGFSNYVLQAPANTPTTYLDGTAFPNSLTVVAGTNLTLQQQNFCNVCDYSQVPTGSHIDQVAPLVTLPSGLRQPVNLTLGANQMLLDTGSMIVTDPGASINLVGFSPNSVPPSTSGLLMLGSITDHGGSLAVQVPYVWVGSQATLDFSGTFVANSTFGEAAGASQSGTLLAGGTVSFDTSSAGKGTGNTPGFVIAQSGASINVSGAAATIVGRVGPANNPQIGALTSVPSWSDGGTVSFNTGTLLWGGTFKAAAGAPQGNGGTLWLGGSNVDLQPEAAVGAPFTVAGTLSYLTSNYNVTSPTVLRSIASVLSVNNVPDIAEVEKLEAFDTVYLYSGVYNVTGGSGFFSAPPPLPSGTLGTTPPQTRDVLTLYGDNNHQLNLSLRNRLFIEAAGILAPTSGPGLNVKLSASYVMFAGAPGLTPPSGASALTVNAQTIDIQTAVFGGFSQVTLDSQGDIRLLSPPVLDGQFATTLGQIASSETTFSGEVATAGNITFEAQRVYPATAVTFEIVSTSPTGTVDFESQPGSGMPAAPLSAGGSLTVSANTIIQNGNLFAPQGQIVLGGATTSSVTLGAGSITSVSLDGITVPYGQTEDGTNWFYNSDLTPLSGPPQKLLQLVGQSVAINANANVDLRGGGDLQAIEFVKGAGGNNDVLSNLVSIPATGSTQATYGYSSQAVYAIFPGNQPKVAAFDIDFNSNLGDRQPLAGQQIYLSGVNGIAAGWYTLYPAHYATLPGAMRVVDDGSALSNPSLAGVTMPDGTQIIGGYYGQSNIGTRSSGTELFAVQTSAVWRQYSEIDSTTASTYFIANAANTATAVPQLPIDAGALQISLTTTTGNLLPDLQIQGNILTSAANLTGAGGTIVRAGLGAQLDISAAQIALVDSAAMAPKEAPANYAAIDADQINNLGFASILIGGLRSQQSNGTLITPSAANVVVNDPNTPLIAPEIILVAAPQITQSTTITTTGTGGGVPVTVMTAAPGTGTVTIMAGSTVQATGTGGSAGANYLLGSATSLATALGGTVDPNTGAIDGVAATSANAAIINKYAAYTGGGALLLVSNDPGVTVTRQNVISGPVTINLVSGANATAAGTLVLPSVPGHVTVAAGAQVGAPSVTSPINGSSASTTNTLVISATGTGSNAGITIGPTATIGANAITLEASSFAIGNSNGASNDAAVISQQVLSQLAAANSLTLRALAGNIDFYPYQGSSNLQNLTLDAASLVGHGQDVGIDATASITLINSSGTAPSSAPAVGGTLSLTSNEIDLGGGNMSIVGFTAVDWTAASQVVVKGMGTLGIGATATDPTPVNLTVFTPNLLVGAGSSGGNGTGSQFALTTLGDFLLWGNGTSPAATFQLGGNLQINAASITLNQGTIQAESGTVTLHATTGNVTLGPGSLISANGYAEVFFDETKYTPGGTVVLISDSGNVVTYPTSTIDVSQPFGAAGELDVTTLGGQAYLFGAITGTGAPGQGGIFRLNTQGGLPGYDSSGNPTIGSSLNNLASILTAGNVTGTIDIHTRTGSIELGSGNTLTAQTISLTADDPAGMVKIDSNAVLDASGTAGGTISLYGFSVDIEGSLYARASDPTQSGGTVTIGTSGIPSGTYDPTYGYEVVLGAGALTFGANSVIDLRSGSDATGYGANSGTVDLRVPLLFSGSSGNVNVVPGMTNPQSQILGVKNVTLEAYAVWSTTDATTGALHFDGTIDPAGNFDSNGNPVAAGSNAAHIGFYQSTLAQFVQNLPLSTVALSNFNNYPFPSGVTFNIQPGIELQNPSTAINGGNISVLSNWNLAAGTISNPQTLNYQNGTQYSYFNNTPGANNTVGQNQSYITFLYRYGVEPGDLTLRAVSNVNINASISDGFFDYQNLSDPTFVAHYQNLAANAPLPPAPVPGSLYQDTTSTGTNANGPSPTNPLASYDLFPSTLAVFNKLTQTTELVAMDSWSFHITAGAEAAGVGTGAHFTSTNPNAAGSLTVYGDTAGGLLGGNGNVIVSGHTSYTGTVYTASGSGSTVTITPVSETISLPTMLRTGTGSITIDAARDLQLTDRSAPGVIYTAGRNAPPLSSTEPFTDPNVISIDSAAGQVSTAASLAGTINGAPKLMGPPTAAAFPEGGGDIVISVQQDIIGFQNVVSGAVNFPTIPSPITVTGVPYYQFYSPWLLSQASSNGTLGAGVFAGGTAADNPQTAWWIEFGRFDQGVLSAGGNITVIAGRNIKDFSVSLPTTGRVSGGLVSGDTPVVHLYGSGNLVVRAGGDLDSGSFYEGSGTATIMVGGSVKSDWNGMTAIGPAATTTAAPYGAAVSTPISTVLAVDTGQLNLTAGGSITITDIVNPAEIQNLTTVADLLKSSSAAVPSMDTYGAQSAVRLTSIGGSVTINSVPGLLANTYVVSKNLFTGATSLTLPTSVTQTYPSTLEITTFAGNITTPTSGFVLTDSPSATLNLLAYGTIDLRGGVAPTSQLVSEQTYNAIAAGTALIDLAFNPFEPNMGDASASDPVLAHRNDPANNLYDRIYAVTGDILGGPVVEIPRPVLVQAGHDIVDLNLTAENIRQSDVSQVIAGYDLYYTGLDIGGGLQIAGPGFFDVEAGHNLGPFLPVADDTAANVTTQQGIVSSGSTAVFATLTASNQTALVSYPVGNNVGLSASQPYYPIGNPNPEFLGSPLLRHGSTNLFSYSGRRNDLLATNSATIVAMFGVAPQITDYNAVVNNYLNLPSYLGDLQNFISQNNVSLDMLGLTGSLSAGTVTLKNPQVIPPLLKAFLDQTFKVNYEGVIVNYLNQPNYYNQLLSFMRQYDVPSFAALGLTTVNNQLTAISSSSISPLLKMFIDQIYFDVLKAVGETGNANYKNYLIGYQMVNTLFPGSFGYTQNNLSGGSNGALPSQQVHTGDLNLLHATIQTFESADIMLFGPGGNIIVGSLAAEPNASLKLNNLGILTLGGGAIDTFTDGSVLVNSSRVFTEQGGDLLMWTSNGNLDAGKGSRTIASLPPLEVNIDNNDYQTIDLGGLVTGSGIGVLQSSSFASASNAILLAPNGEINFSDAGGRFSGNLTALATVVINPGNAQVAGTTSGLPTVTAPNLGSLTTISTVAATQTRSVDPSPTGSTNVQPSVIIVEVLGYGGGEGGATGSTGDQKPDDKSKPAQ